jgi:hypothetical protein
MDFPSQLQNFAVTSGLIEAHFKLAYSPKAEIPTYINTFTGRIAIPGATFFTVLFEMIPILLPA